VTGFVVQGRILFCFLITHTHSNKGTTIKRFNFTLTGCAGPLGGDEGKPGGVMVEFDDGDRGWISLSNIRFLPPGYQIQSKSH